MELHPAITRQHSIEETENVKKPRNEGEASSENLQEWQMGPDGPIFNSKTDTASESAPDSSEDSSEKESDTELKCICPTLI